MLKRLSKALTSDPLKARHKRQIATTVKRNTQHHQKATFVTISYEIIGIWQLLEWMEQTTHQQHQKSTKTAAYRFSARNSRKLSTINFIWCGKLCLSIFLFSFGFCTLFLLLFCIIGYHACAINWIMRLLSARFLRRRSGKYSSLSRRRS